MKISIISKTLQYSIIFIYLCVPYLTSAQDSIFSLGDNYLELGEYNNAALEYERIIYNSNTKDETNKAIFGKANAYKLSHNFTKASGELERIKLFLLEEEEKNIYYYEKILLYYLDSEFEKAALSIEDMYMNIDSSRCYNTLFIQVLVYNELARYEEAKTKADKYIIGLEDNRENTKTEIDNIYSTLPKQKSEKLGNILSFFPGLGHFYAGYYMEGIASFTINASVLSFGIYNAFNAHYITAYLGGAGILSGTYFGSYERGNLMVQKRNYIRRRAFNNKVRKILTNQL